MVAVDNERVKGNISVLESILRCLDEEAFLEYRLEIDIYKSEINNEVSKEC